MNLNIPQGVMCEFEKEVFLCAFYGASVLKI